MDERKTFDSLLAQALEAEHACDCQICQTKGLDARRQTVAYWLQASPAMQGGWLAEHEDDGHVDVLRKLLARADMLVDAEFFRTMGESKGDET